jgi:hypothetical protein
VLVAYTVCIFAFPWYDYCFFNWGPVTATPYLDSWSSAISVHLLKEKICGSSNKAACLEIQCPGICHNFKHKVIPAGNAIISTGCVVIGLILFAIIASGFYLFANPCRRSRKVQRVYAFLIIASLITAYILFIVGVVTYNSEMDTGSFDSTHRRETEFWCFEGGSFFTDEGWDPTFWDVPDNINRYFGYYTAYCAMGLSFILISFAIIPLFREMRSRNEILT